MKTLKIVGILLMMTIAGCATTISGPGPNVGISKTSTFGEDLLATAYNLDNAIAVGALPADDPAAACVHDVLIKAGLETPAGAEPVKSFEPKREGVVSEGAIIYIRAQNLKGLQGMEVSPRCKELIGQVVVDGAAAGRKLSPLGLFR